MKKQILLVGLIVGILLVSGCAQRPISKTIEVNLTKDNVKIISVNWSMSAKWDKICDNCFNYNLCKLSNIDLKFKLIDPGGYNRTLYRDPPEVDFLCRWEVRGSKYNYYSKYYFFNTGERVINNGRYISGGIVDIILRADQDNFVQLCCGEVHVEGYSLDNKYIYQKFKVPKVCSDPVILPAKCITSTFYGN